VAQLQAGGPLRRPRQQRLARALEPRLTAADAPGLGRGEAALRGVLQQIGCLRRPHRGVVDRVVVEASAAHGFQPNPGYLPLSLPSTSPESAAMNASWGTSTRPTIFMRFLPSFC